MHEGHSHMDALRRLSKSRSRRINLIVLGVIWRDSNTHLTSVSVDIVLGSSYL